jgi:two-component system, NarL family, sensor kinase
VEASVGQGLLAGEPAAIAAVDDVVVARVLSSSIVRVKIWSADGRVLYSDEAAEIGGRYRLGEDEQQLLRTGGAAVEVSSLDRAENRLDRGQGKLIEAYTRIRSPSGTPLLFEVYQRFGSVTDSARRLLRALAPTILGAIALIVLIQVPLVWSLTRRLQRGNDEREALLGSAISASAHERQRVASYLHDGPVQEIAGLAYGLAPLADRAAARGDAGDASVLIATTEHLRRTVRDLRSLLVELHPPNLAAAGLAASIADLVSPLETSGVRVSVAIDGADQLDREREALVYRVAQEAIRNVIAYADARSLEVTLEVGEEALLVIADDGRGFRPERREQRLEEGHLGLSLVEELARQSGGRLTITSAEGAGTRVELRMPAR